VRNALAEIEQGRTVRADNAPLDSTPHALEQTNGRYQRRIDEERAKREIWALVAAEGVINREPPSWVHQRRDPRVIGWLTIEARGLAWPIYVGRHTDSLEVGTCLPMRSVASGASVRILTGGTQRERG
jgi:hypothetical protein